MTIHPTKSQIRSICLTQRQHLTPATIAQASQKIIQKLQAMACYQTANHIAWYFPVKGEIDLSTLWQRALEAHKHCYFPSVQRDHLLFLPYTQKTVLLPNQYQILEPKITPQHARDPQDLDLIILPIVAFDSHCNRLGMGKGYYDKTCAHTHHPLLIGVAYEWQKQADLPTEPWDRRLDMIITEACIYS